MVLRKIPYRPLLLKILKLELLLSVNENKNIKVYGQLMTGLALRMVLYKNRGSASKPGSFTPLSEPPASTQEAGRVQTL